MAPVMDNEAVARLREITGVAADEYDFNGATYWTDEQLFAILVRTGTEITPATDPETFTYDYDAAAAEVLEAWSAQLARAYDVTMDGQSLKRSQMAATVAARAASYRGMAGGGDSIQSVEVSAET